MDEEGFESALIEIVINEETPDFQLKLPPPNPITYLEHKQTSLTHQTKQQAITSHIRRPVSQMFNSDFCCGNLFQAIPTSNVGEYDLLLSEDTNTDRYSQWFYFKVNNHLSIPLKLNIINLTKYYALLNNYDFKLYIKVSQWELLQSEVNIIPLNNSYYKLTFHILESYKEFEIALNIPYSLSDLKNSLQNKYCKQLCTSYGGLSIPLIEIGSKYNDIIIIIARQHPGETVSSFVCEGFIQTLLENYELMPFHFIVIPMINVDGVNQGNFRCDLTGQDMNRIWHNPTQQHPQIIEIKLMINKLLQSGKNIRSFIDLHGHTSKLGTFIYACRKQDDPIQCRVFSKIMSKSCKYFDFDSCTYSLNPDKLKTARSIVLQLLEQYQPNVYNNVFTLETSFFGYKYEDKCYQYTLEDLRQIGRDLFWSLKTYYTQSKEIISIINQLNEQRQRFDQEDLKLNESEQYSDFTVELNDQTPKNIKNQYFQQFNSQLVTKTKLIKLIQRKPQQKKSTKTFVVGKYNKSPMGNKINNNQPSSFHIKSPSFGKITRNLSTYTSNKESPLIHIGEMKSVQSSRILRNMTPQKSTQKLKVVSPLFQDNRFKRKNTQNNQRIVKI